MLRRIVSLPNATLVALAVIALALSGLALHRPGPETVGSTPSGAPGPAPGPSTTSSGGPVATGSGTMIAATVHPVTESIVAVDDRVAWRLTTGTCAAGGARLAVTTDGGLAWKAVTSPTTRLVRVQPTSASHAFVIGGSDAGCALGLRSTADGGSSWSPAATIAQAWARDLESPTTIHAPNGGARKPCGGAPVIDLSRVDATRASVVCADGTVRTSADSGRTWSKAARIAGAMAVLAATGRTYAVAPSSSASCRGLSVVAASRGATASCVILTEAPAPGTVSGSVTAAAAWLRVGDRTFMSTDDLRTWHEAGV